MTWKSQDLRRLQKKHKVPSQLIEAHLADWLQENHDQDLTSLSVAKLAKRVEDFSKWLDKTHKPKLKKLLEAHRLIERLSEAALDARVEEFVEWLAEARQLCQTADKEWHDDARSGTSSFDDIPKRKSTWSKLSNKAGDKLVQSFGTVVASIVDTPVCTAEEADALKSVLYKLHLFTQADGRGMKQAPGVIVAAFHLLWLWCRLACPDSPVSLSRLSRGDAIAVSESGRALAFVSEALGCIGLHKKPRALTDLLSDYRPDLLAAGRVTAGDMRTAIEGKPSLGPLEMSSETLMAIEMRLQRHRPVQADENDPQAAAYKESCEQLERAVEKKKCLAEDFFKTFVDGLAQ